MPSAWKSSSETCSYFAREVKGCAPQTRTDFRHIVGTHKSELILIDKIFIKTETLEMYALKAKFDKKINIIELFDNVRIFRGEELITGDYAIINTLNESYKITSNKTKKVKVLLNKTND